MTKYASEQLAQQSREVYAGAGSSAVFRHMTTRTIDQQAAFFLPHLRSGMDLLDCGCGPGTITVGLAKVVMPGRAVGIDIDASQIAWAQTYAAEQKLSNLHFETASIYELPFPDGSFDAVFSNALLGHLRDQMAALREIHRVLRAGGVVGIRNGDPNNHLLTPTDPLLLRFFQIMGALGKQNDARPSVSTQRRAFLRQAGFVDVQASASYDCYGTAQTTRFFAGVVAGYLREEQAVTHLLAAGLVEQIELEQISKAWEDWGEHPDAFFADSCSEVVGWKR
jgi:ubiquinone/menaquinone biosynthesis C-methylase UbiE